MGRGAQAFAAQFVRNLALAFVMLGTFYMVLWTLGGEFAWRGLGGFLVLPIAAAILLVTEVRRCGAALAAKRIAVFVLLSALLAFSTYAFAWAWYRESTVWVLTVAALVVGWVLAFKRVLGAYADWSEETLEASSSRNPRERADD